MKKVLLIIIDALATRVLEPQLQAGRLPNFSRLIEVGQLHRECIAVFPSITPAATCALATGCYPHEHGIAGAYWYDEDQDDVAYFGTDIWAILNEGIDHYLTDFQHELNCRRLRVPTIFEQIEKHGHLRDAVINLLWFRGTVDHEISWPPLFKLIPGDPAEKLPGPHLMFMGDFVNTPLPRGERLKVRGGITRRYGFHDETTADYLLQLAELDSLPEFTLAYFPNNDFDSHKEGPMKAAKSLEQIDIQLGRLFEIHGELASLLEEYAIVITGDHSQSDLSSAKEAAVDLNEVLEQFQVVKAGSAWESGEDVMVCPNMRAAQIYLQEDSWRNRAAIIDCLLKCKQVDQVVWCDSENGLSESRQVQFHVATFDRGHLTFSLERQHDPMGRDDYGAGWTWTGDLRALDAMVDSEGRIRFGDYPNAFERIATAFFRKSGSLWVTARLGHEFCLPNTACNEKGSHGSLHSLDSTSPVIAAGLPASITLPEKLRSVDVTPLCLMLLDLDPPRRLGESHVT
ncbi:alkaline phosphatase family protein [Bythopirellula goksoeyrii]|nr:alkaline phosphatase family protein [Bythopirellula goksoeyrii]